MGNSTQSFVSGYTRFRRSINKAIKRRATHECLSRCGSEALTTCPAPRALHDVFRPPETHFWVQIFILRKLPFVCLKQQTSDGFLWYYFRTGAVRAAFFMQASAREAFCAMPCMCSSTKQTPNNEVEIIKLAVNNIYSSRR